MAPFNLDGETTLALASAATRRYREIEDAVPEAAAAIVAAATSHPGKPLRYYARVAQNAANRLAVREARNRRIPVQGLPPRHADDPADRIIEHLDGSRELVVVREAVRQLPPNQRKVVEAVYYAQEPATSTELSRALGLSPANLRMRHSRALSRLRSTLRDIT